MSDFRLQYHAIFAPHGAVTRYHSFGLEARVCREDMSDCGIIRTGGWLDYGHLTVGGENPENIVPLPNDPPVPSGPYAVRPVRIHCFEDTVQCRVNRVTWYGAHRQPQEEFFRGVVEVIGLVGEAWAPVNPNDTTELKLLCPNNECEINGSAMEAHLVSVRAMDEETFDPYGDGFANYQGYTNRYGAPVDGCTAPGLDCVPLEITNVPMNVIIQHRDDTHGVSPVEYDISPAGEHWLTYPN